MKKLLTGLASFALILVGGVSLAACGGNGNLVNTSGKYEVVEDFNEVQTALADFVVQDAEAYEFRLTYNYSDESTSANSSNMSASYRGKIDLTEGDSYGDMSFDSNYKMSGTIGGMQMNMNQSGEFYYDASEDYYYFKSGDIKIKSQSFDAADMLNTFKNLMSLQNVYDLYFAADYNETYNNGSGAGDGSETTNQNSAIYQISTSDGYTKIYLAMKEYDEGVESTGNVYLVLDSEDNFVGFHMSGVIMGGEIVLEYVSSTSGVEFPEDLDTYEAV